MNKALKALCAVAVSASFALAGDAKDSKDLKKVIEDQGIYVETSQKGIVLSGYVDAGYTYGFSSENNTLGLRNAQDGGTAANTKGDFNINAFKLALEKQLSNKNEYTAGFRGDVFVGEDAQVLRGTANAADGASDIYLHQAYVAFRAPVGNGWDFKVGRFATPVGYEVAERPANLNISYGLLWQNIQPVNHTGILSSYKVNDIVELEGGIANGTWNSADGVGVTNGAGADAYNLIFGVNLKNHGGNANIKNTFIGTPARGGGEGTGTIAAGNQANDGSLFLWDMWANWAPKCCNDKLLIGINTDLGFANDYANRIAPVQGVNDETFWGVALYTKYQFNKILSLAQRFGYVHNTDALKFGSAGVASDRSVDAFESTTTLSFNVWENMLLRAEYRADVTSSAANNDGQARTSDSLAHLVSLQAVYSF